jgi:Ca2+/Na+ antiporter
MVKKANELLYFVDLNYKFLLTLTKCYSRIRNMETVYIMMICAAVIFILLIVAYILFSMQLKKAEQDKEQMLEEYYSAPNIPKMEYDLAFYDEDNGKSPTDDKAADEQVTVEEVIENPAGSEQSSQNQNDAIFAKIDKEGVEEITGTFKRD